MPVQDVVVGVDVGTGSARVGIFDTAGKMLGHASHAITMWKEGADIVEQSSDDVWRAVCACVRTAMASSTGHVAVKGIGFTATCSLVVLDEAGAPLSVGRSGSAERNIIVCMDHRAKREAALVNQTGAEVLRYAGGQVSVEMQVPKLLWLKHNLPQTWEKAAHFFDLPDFLTWRATGSLSRSMCSLVCKWTYLGHENRWDESFFRQIGLAEFIDDGFARIGATANPLGATAGRLSAAAAAELGLPPGVPVATSAIDAHAGGIGLLGARLAGDELRIERRLALIGGTSSCHMVVSSTPQFVPGVWGPYHSALMPGLWLSEGGQSATGALIDHVLLSSRTGQEMQGEAKAAGTTVYALLNAELAAMAEGMDVPAALTAGLHVMPDFHGNRSPRADASLLGMISGLALSDTRRDLARLYLATVQAVAYGTRHIIETLNANGCAVESIFACGGGTKNPVFLREHADATGMRIVLGEEEEAVLLGAAVLAAVSAGVWPGMAAAMAAMSKAARVVEPAAAARDYHERKYQVFKRMHEDQLAYRAMMIWPSRTGSVV